MSAHPIPPYPVSSICGTSSTVPYWGFWRLTSIRCLPQWGYSLGSERKSTSIWAGCTPERQFKPRSCFLLPQNLPCLFLTHLPENSGRVAVVDICLGQKHVTVWTAEVREITFLQNHYRVCMWKCTKRILRLVRLVARHLQPLTGNPADKVALDNDKIIFGL